MSQYRLDKAIGSVWNRRFEDGRNQPWLASIQLRYGDPLLTRFQKQYRLLKRFPRRLRRLLSRKLSMSLGTMALLLALSFAPPDLTVKSSVITGDTQFSQLQTQNQPVGFENNLQQPAGFPNNPSAIIVVNGNNPGTDCTLSDAIIAANTDTTAGNCIAGSGDDIIDIQVNVNLTAPVPNISSKVVIEGNGNTIAGDDTFGPLLQVVNSGDMTLNEATVSNGFGTQSFYGGGIFIFNGSASINDSTISYNQANYGGGGVANWHGTLVMTNTIILDNSALRGGGIVNIGGDATLINSEVSGNSATVYGGGIRNIEHGNLHLIDCTISGNNAPDSGGLLNREYSYMLVENSTISHHDSIALKNERGSELIVNNSTISGNNNIGIWSSTYRDIPSKVTINDSTISGNSSISGPGAGVFINSGEASINRSLISNNTGLGYANDVYNLIGSLTIDNYNLFGHDGLTTAESVGGFTPGITDILATSDGTLPTPLVEILDTTLQNNGGSTETHALPPISPAVDGVSDGSCTPSFQDQRHQPRPVEGDGDGVALCDVGSFELVRTVYLPIILKPATNPNLPALLELPVLNQVAILPESLINHGLIHER